MYMIYIGTALSVNINRSLYWAQGQVCSKQVVLYIESGLTKFKQICNVNK